MGESFSFTVPGRITVSPKGKKRCAPVTWQRTNHVLTKPRRGRAPKVVRKTDAAQRLEKRRIASIALAARPPGWPLDAEYRVTVVGYWPDRRFGDADRLTSLSMDALEGVAYRKDRQVAAQSGTRAVDRERPRTEVTVKVLSDAG